MLQYKQDKGSGNPEKNRRKEKKMFVYDVDIHFKGIGWDTYTVNSTCLDNARCVAVNRVSDECGKEYLELIDCIRIYPEKSMTLLKQYDI